LKKCAQALDGGGVVVVPTDTVYGLAARIDRIDAIDKIFEIKNRSRDKPLPVLVRDIKQAKSLAWLPEEALKAAEERWPGSLTIIDRSVQDVSFLGGDGQSIALRVPDHRFVLDLIQQSGPLVATSANIAGHEPGKTITQIVEQLSATTVGGTVTLYIDGGIAEGSASEVISYLGSPTKLR